MKLVTALFLLLSPATHAFNTSPNNVRASFQLNGYRQSYQQQLEDISKGIANGEVNGAPVNGAAINGEHVNGNGDHANGSVINGASVNGPTVNGIPPAPVNPEIAKKKKAAATAAELKIMQDTLAEAELRLAALKSELPSAKAAPTKERKKINLKLPSLSLPKISIPQKKKSEKQTVEKTVKVAEKTSEVVKTVKEVKAVETKEKAHSKKEAKAEKLLEKNAKKPIAAKKPVPVKSSAIKAPKVNAKVPKSNKDYLSSLPSNSMKIKPRSTSMSAGYLDSISKKPIHSRLRSIVDYKMVAKLDGNTLLAYQFLRNVAGCISISAAWYMTSLKYGLSPLAPGLWKPTTAMSVACFLVINILRPARVSLSTKISSFWEGMTGILQRRLNLSKPAAKRVAVAINVMASAVLLTGGIALAAKMADVPIDKVLIAPIKKGGKRVAKAAAGRKVVKTTTRTTSRLVRK